MLEGWRKRRVRDWEDRAWLAMVLANAQGATLNGRPFTIDALLGRPQREPELTEEQEREQTAAEYQTFLRGWIAKVEALDPKDRTPEVAAYYEKVIGKERGH